MVAIIDIGSNSIRLSVYEVNGMGDIRQAHRLKSVVGLAGMIDKRGFLSETGIIETCAVLTSFRDALRGIKGVTETHVFATASLRNVLNAQQVTEAVKRNTGFDVVVISGEEEAICDYMGAMNRVAMDDGIMVDIGGGSTELVICREGRIEKVASITIGSLDMYSKYVSRVIPTKAECEDIRKETQKKLEAVNGKTEKVPEMCGVGGTMRALCKLNNAIFGDPPENRIVTAKNAKRLCRTMEDDFKSLIPKILQIMPERVHTITPGLLILSTIIKKYDCETITVSESGVREGYLIKNVLRRDINHGAA